MKPITSLLAIMLLGARAGDGESSGTGTLLELDVAAMQQLLVRNDKVVLLLQAGACSRAAEFAPTFQTIAERVPNLPFGRFDVRSDAKVSVSFAHGVEPEGPALKAFFKNAPPHRRVLEYRGPPTLESVLSWAQAVEGWDGSDKLVPGWEVDSTPPPSASQPEGSDKAEPKMKAKRKEAAKSKDEM